MKYLITGANGMLGGSLCPIIRAQGNVIYPTDIMPDNDNNIVSLDIADKKAVQASFRLFKPDFVFHLAAETNVDKCELEPEHARRVNIRGTENIALACKDLGIVMAYISTCGVFDGQKKEPYNEDDEPNPISVYSKTKYEGENIVKAILNKRYYIFRAGWMMGGGSGKDKKFIAKIVKLLNTESEIAVVNDKFGNPTYTIDMSMAMMAVIQKECYGLYHMVNIGSCSRYDIACKIREYLKKDSVMIKPIFSSQFPLAAPRPRSEAAENKRLGLIGLGGIMRPWQEALNEYLAELIAEE